MHGVNAEPHSVDAWHLGIGALHSAKKYNVPDNSRCIFHGVFFLAAKFVSSLNTAEYAPRTGRCAYFNAYSKLLDVVRSCKRVMH